MWTKKSVKMIDIHQKKLNQRNKFKESNIRECVKTKKCIKCTVNG